MSYYDETEKTISLTSDECDLLRIALESIQDIAYSTGERITIEILLEKLQT